MPRIDNENLEKLAKRTAEYVNTKASNTSKRELFAGMAMQGIASTYGSTYINDDIADSIAKDSVKMADALIKKLDEDV